MEPHARVNRRQSPPNHAPAHRRQERARALMRATLIGEPSRSMLTRPGAPLANRLCVLDPHTSGQPLTMGSPHLSIGKGGQTGAFLLLVRAGPHN
eukprot:scaffold97154_cov32-Tisochrysis_lutea.AAC.5